MAGLTDTLPLTQGTNRVIDDPAGVNPLGPALDLLGAGLDSYMGIRRQQAENKRRAAAEAEKQRKADSTYQAITGYDRALAATSPGGYPAGNAPVTDPLDSGETAAPLSGGATGPASVPEQVFNTGSSDSGLTPEATSEVERRGKFVANVAAAVEQSKMPAISLTTALNTEFRRLINQYPDQAENVLDIWKKMGIDTTLFREGRDAADWADAERESQQAQIEDDRKFEQQMFENGAKALGEMIASGGPDGGPMSREQVIAHGFTVSRQAYDFEVTSREARLQMEIAGSRREEAKAIETDKNQKIEQLLQVGVYNDSNPLISMIQNTMTSLSKLGPTDKVAKWQEFAPRINAVLDNYVERAVAGAVAQGYTGDVNTLRNNLNATVSRAKELWSGDFSVAKSYTDALTLTQTTLKINAAQAMPVFTALRAVGINASEIQGYMEGLQGNTGLQTALRDEMRGFSTDFGAERASTRLMNIVKILRGEDTLANMSGEQARQRLPELFRISDALNRRYLAGEDVSRDQVLNGLGELTIATRALGPSSGVGAVLKATQGFAIPRQRAALLKTLSDPNATDDDKAQTQATILASRAASAQLLNIAQANIPKINNGSRYFKIIWDNRNGTYRIDDSGKRKALAEIEGAVGKPGTPNFNRQFVLQQRAAIANAKPPAQMVQWQDAANVNLDNIMALAKSDPNTPKASNLELRNYYGRNVLPKSMKEETGTAKPVDVEKEVEEQFLRLEKTLDDLDNLNTNVAIADTRTVGERIRAKYPNNDNVEIAASVAGQVGVPEHIALALFDTETGFRPRPGPMVKSGTHAGDAAQGLGQVMPKTAEAYGVSRAELASMDVEEQARLALRILKDNYNKTGNWKDAVSMYFTGRTYAKAMAQGATDGFTKVRDYVRNVLGE